MIVTHNIRILDDADEIFQMEDGHLGVAAREQLALSLPTLMDRELEEVVGHSDLQVYQPGDVIIRQGDIATAFFILVKGEVDILHTRQDMQKEFIATRRNHGDYFGEIGLLQENALRTATVRAAGSKNVEVLAIGRDTFLKMVGDSKMARAVIKDEMIERLIEIGMDVS